MMSMSIIMAAHTVMGIALVVTGFTALLARKGSTVHRLSGKTYIWLLLPTSFTIAISALTMPGTISYIGMLFVTLTLYFVLTAMRAVRKDGAKLGVVDYLAPVAGLTICGLSTLLGLAVLKGPGNTATDAAPVEAYFFFVVVTLIASLLDINHLRLGGVRGKHKFLRHVWRMSISLYFATSSLFTGPGSMLFPEPIRDTTLLLIPEYLVIAIVLYWIGKLNIEKVKPIFLKQHNG